jgi:hypothetical protein
MGWVGTHGIMAGAGIAGTDLGAGTRGTTAGAGTMVGEIQSLLITDHPTKFK